MREQIDSVEHVISVGGGEGALDFEKLIATQASGDEAVLQERRPTGVDPFFIMFTSGTTGRPKADLHLHANSQHWIKAFEELQNFPQDAHWMLVTPIAHLTGLGIGVIGALKRGAVFTLLTAWDADECVGLLERGHPTYLLGASPMLIDLARNPGLDERVVSSVEKIYYTGAPCPAEILNTLNDKLGCEIIAFYGCTEAGATHGTCPGVSISVTSRSIGVIALGMEMRLVDDDGNDISLPGEGELWVGGAQLHRRLLRTARRHRADVHRRRLVPVGRHRPLRRGGLRLLHLPQGRPDQPRRLQDRPPRDRRVALRPPKVAQAAAVAMPDDCLGQRVAAFIVPKEPKQELWLDEVTGFLDEKGLSRTKWPEAVEMVEEFPMTGNGKFMRYNLRERAEQLRPQRLVPAMTAAPTEGPGLVVHGGTLATVADTARRAEASGFGSVWTTEFYDRSALIALAAMAQATTSITIGSAIMYAVGRSPLVLATEARDLAELAAVMDTFGSERT